MDNGTGGNVNEVFYGEVNTALFLHWILHLLVPSLLKGQVVIMDNTSIHKNSLVRELVEGAGCKLLYLPTYSPDLNPIENYWAVMKKTLEKSRNKYAQI